MPYQPELSDLKIPAFPKLLERALKALEEQGLKPFAPIEQLVLGMITQEEDPVDSKEGTGMGDWVVYQVDYYKLPKYVALISWLNAFGLVSQHPNMVLRIARYLLGETRREEERKLPSEIRALLR